MSEQMPHTMPECRQPAVAVVLPTMPQDGAGGVTSAHFNIYRCLKSLGCTTHLLSFSDSKRSPGEPGAIRCGAPVWLESLLDIGTFIYLKVIGSKKIVYQLADIIFSIPGSLQIRRFIRKLQPDITIVPDHGAPGLSLSNTHSPIILVVHHVPARFIAHPLLGDFCHIDVAKATALEQLVLKHVNAVVCPSDYMKQVFQKTYSFNGEVVVIPNPIDENLIDSIEMLDVRTELGLPGEAPVVYIPSAGSPLKGAKYVFEIVRRLAKANNGPIGFYLSGVITPVLRFELDHAPENVFLFTPGHISLKTNIAYVKSCTFGISPTLIESYGMAILEAGFCNVPMVAFDVGGTGEVIRDGVNGLLSPFLDVEQLINNATKFLDAEFVAKVSRSTGKFVRERFDSHRIANEYLSLCKKQIDLWADNF